jgi:hypothetical protein
MEISNVLPNIRGISDLHAAVQQAESPPIKKSSAVDGQVQIPAVEHADMKRADSKRLDDIERTVKRNSFKDVYAVRDNSFTIFKDSSGQYITRFTSLRDGSVKYVPEPEILKYSGGSDSYYQVTA